MQRYNLADFPFLCFCIGKTTEVILIIKLIGYIDNNSCLSHCNPSQPTKNNISACQMNVLKIDTKNSNKKKLSFILGSISLFNYIDINFKIIPFFEITLAFRAMEMTSTFTLFYLKRIRVFPHISFYFVLPL